VGLAGSGMLGRWEGGNGKLCIEAWSEEHQCTFSEYLTVPI
jgi:uncharacterized protein YhfF